MFVPYHRMSFRRTHDRSKSKIDVQAISQKRNKTAILLNAGGPFAIPDTIWGGASLITCRDPFWHKSLLICC